MASFVGPYYWTTEVLFPFVLEDLGLPDGVSKPHGIRQSPSVARIRKRELIGQQYLQGKTPLIQSAQLKGPFDQKTGWVNPWRFNNSSDSVARSDSHDHSYVQTDYFTERALLLDDDDHNPGLYEGQNPRIGQKRMAHRSWLKTTNLEKRSKSDSPSPQQSPTPSTRERRQDEIPPRESPSFTCGQSHISRHAVVDRHLSVAHTAQRGPASLRHVTPAKPHMIHDEESEGDNMDDKLEKERTTSEIESQTPSRSNEDLNSSDHSGSFHFKINRNRQSGRKSRSLQQETARESTSSTNLVGLGIMNLNGLEMHAYHDVQRAVNEQPVISAKSSVSGQESSRNQPDMDEGSTLIAQEQSPDPLSMGTSTQSNLQQDSLRRSSLPANSQMDYSSSEPMLKTEEAREATLRVHQASNPASSPRFVLQNVKGRHSPDAINILNQNEQQSSFAKRNIEATCQNGLNLDCISQKGSENLKAIIDAGNIRTSRSNELEQLPWVVQRPWQHSSLGANLPSSGPHPSDADDLCSPVEVEIEELLSSSSMDISVGKQGAQPSISPAPEDMGELRGEKSHEDSPTKPFQGLLSPSPVREKDKVALSLLPSTQSLIESVIVNPWDSPQKGAMRARSKKRVSFGIAHDVPEGSASPDQSEMDMPAAYNTKNRYCLKRDLGPSRPSVRRSIFKSEENLHEDVGFHECSPPVDAMTEAFVLADQEACSAVSIQQPLCSDTSCRSRRIKSSDSGYYLINSKHADVDAQDSKNKDLSFSISPLEHIMTGIEDDDEEEENLGAVIEDMGNILESWDVDTELKKARGKLWNQVQHDMLSRRHLSPVLNR